MSNMPLRLGQFLVLCDRCKFKRYDDQLIENWQGLRVCKPTVKQGCWEPRHPQDFIRTVVEDIGISWARPRPTDTFVSVTFNCDASETRPYPSIMGQSLTMAKGFSRAPVIIESGATITVLCEWVIS